MWWKALVRTISANDNFIKCHKAIFAFSMRALQHPLHYRSACQHQAWPPPAMNKYLQFQDATILCLCIARGAVGLCLLCLATCLRLQRSHIHNSQIPRRICVQILVRHVQQHAYCAPIWECYHWTCRQSKSTKLKLISEQEDDFKRNARPYERWLQIFLIRWEFGQCNGLFKGIFND